MEYRQWENPICGCKEDNLFEMIEEVIQKWDEYRLVSLEFKTAKDGAFLIAELRCKK